MQNKTMNSNSNAAPDFITRLKENRVPILLALLIAIITFVAYIPCLKGGFIWDDNHMVHANSLIKAGVSDGLMKFWFTNQNFDYFPLTFTTLWVEWRLWGMDPTGYRVVNILLHIISALLIWRILKRLNVPAPWFIGAVFAVHPVAVASVAWIAERKNTLSMVFFLLSLLMYLRFEDEDAAGRKTRKWYILSLVSFVAAMLSKTSVAMLPIVLLGLSWWRRGRIARKDLERTAPFFAVSFLLGLVAVWFQYNRAIGRGIGDIRPENEGFFSIIAASGWSLWWYISKALVPQNLMMVPPRWHVEPLNPVAWIPLILYGTVAWVCWKNRADWGRNPLAAMGYHLINLIPVLGISKIYFMRFSLVGDHWHYIAYIGPVALAIAVAAIWVSRQNEEIRRAAHIGAGFLLCVLCALTWKHSALYANERELWLQNIRQNREGWVAYHNVAALFPKGSRESIDFFTEAINLNPRYHEAYYGRGVSYNARGELQAAANDLQQAVALRPDYFAAQNELGVVCLRGGLLTNAVSFFSKAIETRPNMLDARINLAATLMVLGNTNEANIQAEEAIKRGAPDVLILQNIGTTLFAAGKHNDAAGFFTEAIKRGSGSSDPATAGYVATAYFNLGLFYLMQQKTQEAYDNFSAALNFNSKHVETLMHRANILISAGYTDRAATDLIQVINLRPELAVARLRLADVLLAQDKKTEALQQLQIALQYEPENLDVHIGMSSALAASGQFGSALNNLKFVLDRVPNNPVALLKRASIFLSTGGITDAEKDYRQILFFDPASIDALTGLARIYSLNPDEKARDTAKAVDLAEKASLLSKGELVLVEDTLATAYFQDGNTNKAFEVVERAISLATSNNQSNIVQNMKNLRQVFENTLQERDRTKADAGIGSLLFGLDSPTNQAHSILPPYKP